MARFSKSAMKIAKSLGVDPESIQNNLEASSRLAAEAVQTVLQRMIDDLESSSESGALLGYRAIAVKTNAAPVRLRRSGIKFDSFEWVAFVEASPWHQQLDPPLNVFDILDQGRPTLPGGKTYPLWGISDPGAAGGSRLPSGRSRIGSRFSVAAQIERPGAIRVEPRSRGQRVVSGERRSLAFREGPIAKVDPHNLYKRAFGLARRRVGGIVDRRVWALIYVPRREEWIR